MTKQEEIREGIRTHLNKLYTRCYGKEPEGMAINYIEHCLTNILMLLEFEGVVIKVDRELPAILDMFPKGVLSIQSEVITKTIKYVLEAGYVAVEPLIGITDEDKV